MGLNSGNWEEMFGGVGVGVKKVIANSQSIVVFPVAGPEAYCSLKTFYRFLHIAFSLPALARPFLRVVADRLQLNCALELFDGAVDLAGPVINDAQRYVHLCLIGIKHQRVIACGDSGVYPNAVMGN